ncbi:MAG: hypothetical protein ACT4R6_11560, partial [Gemmatimonadaceae bacterium]
MAEPISRRPLRGLAIGAVVLGLAAVLGRALLVDPAVESPADTPLPDEELLAASVVDSGPAVVIADSLFGLSGALRFRTLTAAEAVALAGFIERFGERAIHKPALHRVGSRMGSFSLLVMEPFGAKRGEMLNGYRLGRWPAERWMMARNY